MKISLQQLLNRKTILVVIILLLAVLIRFINFPNRVTFWSEQARSLIVSANYLHHKFSLMGQEYFRKDSNSHVIYSGAVFNYSLIPVMLISSYDPIQITAFFAFLNITTGLIIFFIVNKLFNFKLAAINLVVFLFNSLMIYHSMFIWNYNFLPLLGVLLTYLLYLLYKNKRVNYFWIGLLCGIGISIQVLFLPVVLVILIYCLVKSRNKVKDFVFVITGLVLGNLPMIVFDLRHNFYETRTLFQFLIDTLAGKSDAGFSYYYLLPFWPLFIFAISVLVFKIFKLNNLLGMAILYLYLLINLNSAKISFNTPTGMPYGLTVADIKNTSQKIAVSENGNFNVAADLDFDKQAYVLRYYLEFVLNKKPLEPENYKNLNTLYVLAPKDYNFAETETWELKATKFKIIKPIYDIQGRAVLYKLIN